ncbi:uncharacterized protein LOC26536261 isoform X10 [Drosophila yakuba]|uniref:uncharacterized protein LOC26536261 isoform X10 n=1 Tax=Drosophila yakuba TaxID=7245 RepID=UPI001930897D|nr:uncharacterized protein LOC26536261 isoform X10 [Drosophila yakuba]
MLERILLLKKAIYQFVYTMSIGRKVGYADMTAMSEIDEIGINQNLNVRYNSDIIYTYTGSILLAVNPYKSINIYNTPTLQTPLKQQPATQPVGQPQDSFQPQNFVPIALQQLVAFYPNSPAPPPSIAIRPEGDERASGCFFTLLESQFASLRITVDKIKFHQTLNFLPAEYLETIMYILRNPPTGRYEAIKARIIAEHMPSTQSQFAQLFRSLELEESKPSVLLRRMRKLARDGIGEDAQKALWLERLPEGLTYQYCPPTHSLI